MAEFGDDRRSDLRWRISSHCNGGNCVEVAALPGGGVALRDGKDAAGPVLEFTPAEWRSWVSRVKSGELDRHP
ncbi:DUF397 domain-containing protein [Spongiactinospora sp. TRM90649]|uniref:DUF397 domain-containing protein n=1 Tax=Spongiactinospora sp. TRM90649 TaxID=3031114 RepID=UPI0023F879E9|nr:DUF397 domain-containing protein [Spongiactinospora sp. TRM90649]MDF5752492.1 DUF397 domain-containing protein [Spongiactinospora sp. TRM90649]